jgi:hypothetical protein
MRPLFEHCDLEFAAPSTCLRSRAHPSRVAPYDDQSFLAHAILLPVNHPVQGRTDLL